MIDIGVNFIGKSFQADLPDVLERARKASVKNIILTGTSVYCSEESFKIAKNHPDFLYSTAGIHPHDASTFNEDSLIILENLLKNPQVVAVGECGLDFNRDFSPRVVQEEVFRQQILLALKLKKPLFLHQRDAHQKLMAILSEFDLRNIPVVVHCFTGTWQECEEILAAGFHVGITGWICDEKRGGHMKEFVGKIPLEKLMIETDSPYLLPKNLLPKPKSNRNEPAFLKHIASEIAAVYGIPLDEFCQKVTATTEKFFNLKKSSG